MVPRFIRVRPEDLVASDLIIVAPTGSGKTTATIRAVAEALKRGYFRRAIYLVPTKALAAEIEAKAKAVLPAGWVVRDDSDARLERRITNPMLRAARFIVTTYERGDSLITSDPSFLKDAVLVMDEVHNMLNPKRSTYMINTLAYLKMTRAEEGYRNRAVLLSATMPEMEGLAKYLGARIIAQEERPVEVSVETVEVPAARYARRARDYMWAKYMAVLDLFRQGKLSKKDAPILIYVPSRRWAEEFARRLASDLPGFNVEVHHAGIPLPKRRRIEEELRKPNPSIDIVVATDTLTQGVNMAFKTVIVPVMKRYLPRAVVQVDPATIVQVIGRAGRPGMAERGRAVILYAPDEYSLVEKALRKEYGEVTGPGDYPALVLRLRYTGRDPEVWARYAYKVDPEKMRNAIEVLHDLGFMRGGDLTELGLVAAAEYVPYPGMLVMKAIHELERRGVNVDELRRALYYALSYQEYAGGAWKNLTYLANVAMNMAGPEADKLMVKLQPVENVIADLLSSDEELAATMYKLATELAKTETGSVVPEHFPLVDDVYVKAMMAPNSPVVSDWEGVRKAASVIRRMAEMGLVDRRLADAARYVAAMAVAERRAAKKIPDFAPQLVLWAMDRYGRIEPTPNMDKLFISEVAGLPAEEEGEEGKTRTGAAWHA